MARTQLQTFALFASTCTSAANSNYCKCSAFVLSFFRRIQKINLKFWKRMPNELIIIILTLSAATVETSNLRLEYYFCHDSAFLASKLCPRRAHSTFQFSAQFCANDEFSSGLYIELCWENWDCAHRYELQTELRISFGQVGKTWFIFRKYGRFFMWKHFANKNTSCSTAWRLTSEIRFCFIAKNRANG